MEPAVAGALYTAESLIGGAVALVKGVIHPTLPLKAKLTHITSVPIPRAQHTISVVKGRAYIFGGEVGPGRLANNDMQIVVLPSSGVLEADYTWMSTRPAEAGGEVPQPRRGHSAVVIGDCIYIYGGEGVQPEGGRIWVYSTISNTWTFLDSPAGTLYPSHRAGHAAASSELPGPIDITYKERAPQQPADPSKVVPEPADEDTWGTIFIVGGRHTETGELLADGLAFDIRSRTWSNIPSPPGEPREGASMTLVGNRLYRFGGKGANSATFDNLQVVDVSPVWKHAEGGTTPLTSGWTWEELPHPDGEAPHARTGVGLTTVTTGLGRNYLLAIGGEGEGNSFFDDIWAFQLPSERASLASAKDQTRTMAKRETNEAKWAEASYIFEDMEGEEKKREVPGLPKRGLGLRGHFALAQGTEVDGATAVVWGGVGPSGEVLGDGWLVTVDR